MTLNEGTFHETRNLVSWQHPPPAQRQVYSSQMLHHPHGSEEASQTLVCALVIYIHWVFVLKRVAFQTMF